MAYVPGFEYDLFLSYASDDFDERLAGLIQELRLYLRRELGKDFSQDRGIFLDRNELNYTPVAWKQRLAEGARSAAILVPIVSPAYATSDYCAKEWELETGGRPVAAFGHCLERAIQPGRPLCHYRFR